MSNKPHTGGCHCGAVRFKTSETPVRALACHCTACKLRTGAPYGIGVYFKEEDVEFISAEGSEIGTYEFHSDTSNRWMRNEFCKKCGSAVSWTLEMRPGLRAIAGGSFDDPNWYDVKAHLWTQSARTDMCYPDEIDIYEQAIT